ncbi:DUF5988 family protein [Actinomadura terrae]|uniref:DUF5988 family protein n=1 Tax=Actinomadura terrae TaxID=604353 RepID=UPI001FA6E4E0|nr:DUF5988 family protein [Actinomadura terrae]
MSEISGLVILRDGPPTLEQVRHVTECVIADSERVVVTHGGRNEHFARTDNTGVIEGRSASVYTWVYSTAIAE